MTHKKSGLLHSASGTTSISVWSCTCTVHICALTTCGD